MAARTFPDGYGNPPAQLTAAQIAAKHDRLNPEFLRRVLLMMDACPSSLGIGGGARSSALQEQLFRSRYTPYTIPPGIFWSGAYWRKNDGVASAAPPGSSYHEDDIPGGALAVDMIGDLKWMKAACGLFGLREFSEVNAEPWHVQPVEVPAARSKWDGTPIPVWGQQPPTDPEEDEDMADIKYIATPPKDMAGNPPWFVCADASVTYATNEAVRQAQAKGWPLVEVNAEQYAHLKHAAGM